MKIILLVLSIFLPLNIARTQYYYASINEGESNKKALRIHIQNNCLDDTICVLYTLIHNVHPSPQNVKGWKKEFTRIEPLNVLVAKKELNGDSLVFTTAKCYYYKDDWFFFSFTGRIVNGIIKGILTQVEYEGFGKRTYTDNYKITFYQ